MSLPVAIGSWIEVVARAWRCGLPRLVVLALLAGVGMATLPVTPALAQTATAQAVDPSALQTGLQLLKITNGKDGGQTYSVSLQVLAFMTLLSLLPALLITMTSFTRILVVLAILRQGLGTQQTPSNQILVGIALFLTFFVMAPVGRQVYTEAVKPYMAQTLPADKAIEAAAKPIRTFMLAQTRKKDLMMFENLSNHAALTGPDDVPFSLLLPAFVTSELKTAFEIGFMLLIPFLVIDLVVASVLMSMGMVMLSPLIISLPFKIMLFVLVDGWSLVMSTLAGSFHVA